MVGAEAAERLRVRGASGELRGTQSFVRVMAWCWRHPSAVALEVGWRWVFGLVAVAALWRWGVPVLAGALGGATGEARAVAQVEGLSLLEPVEAVRAMTVLLEQAGPAAAGVTVRVGVPLLAWWVVCATVGRRLVLRRVDGAAGVRWGAAFALQVARLVGLGSVLGAWGAGLRWAAARELTGPMRVGQEPAMVPFFAVAILLTLLLFVGWSVVSEFVSLPPLLALWRGMGARDAVGAVSAGGGLRMKLVEINLVMGIVKVALVVLLMVFSACPLPFQSAVTMEFLLWWTAAGMVLYLVASDFFHVARAVGYLRVWEFFREGVPR